MTKLVGIEINWSLVRASVVDEETNKVELYDDHIVLNAASNGFVDPTEAIKQLWNNLGLHEGSIRVVVTIGAEFAGIISATDAELDIAKVANEANTDIAWREIEGNRVAYIRNDYLHFLREIFVTHTIPVDRIELAPEAMLRVLKPSYSGKLTLTSGAGWDVLVEVGEIHSATTSPDVWKKPGVNVKTSNSVTQISGLRNVDLPDEVVDRYQIEPADLAVSVGAAIAPADASKGFFDSSVVSPSEPEVQTYETELDSDTRSEVEVEKLVGATLGSSKLTSIIDKFRNS